MAEGMQMKSRQRTCLLYTSNAVSGGEAAGHGYSRVTDIAVAAGSFPVDDLYFVTGAYKTGTFHFKFNGSHDKFMPSF